MQLDLFQVISKTVDINIPKSIIAPHRSSYGVKSREFKKVQINFSFYCQEIMKSYECTFFEARKKLKECRDNEKTVKVLEGFNQRLENKLKKEGF